MSFRSRQCLIAALLFGFSLSLISPVLADARSMKMRPAARKVDREIARVSERWATEWSANNLEAVIALYAEDAVFLPSTGSRIVGRKAIRELFAGALTTHSAKLRVQSKVIEQSGNIAFDSGEYEETSTSAGVSRTGRGNYLVILRRQGNQWRIVQHMWTDAPAGSAQNSHNAN